jgi:hypothetical protein
MSRIVGPAVLAVIFTGAAHPAEAQTGFVIQHIHLTGVNYDPLTGVLTATGGTVNGLLEGVPFTTAIKHFELDPAQAPACSVLHLRLAPIHISLLGLHIDTTPICLRVTAFPNEGILGNLLCGLAGGNLNLLSSPDLTSGLTHILNAALSHGTSEAGTGVCRGQCVVLDLFIGPLTLDLLGVEVHLANCSSGPIQVCVSATASQGLLGSLLCSLAGDHLTLKEIAELVDLIESILGQG